MASTPTARMPVLGAIPQTKISAAKKNIGKPNQSILSFFGKAPKQDSPQESPSKDANLFFEESTPVKKQAAASENSQATTIDSPRWDGWSQDDRFHENVTPVKRRKLDRESSPTDSLLYSPTIEPKDTPADDDVERQSLVVPQKEVKHRGGFIDDSDDEEGSESPDNNDSVEEQVTDVAQNEQMQDEKELPEIERQQSYAETTEEVKVPLKPPDDEDGGAEPPRPRLSRHGTSGFQVDDFGPEDFDDEFFPEGEEYMERQSMEE